MLRGFARGVPFALAVAVVVLGVTAARAASGDFGRWITFEKMLERRDARASGRIVEVEGFRVASPFLRDPNGGRTPTLSYSAATKTVYEISGPGWIATEPEYYLVDGAYFVYDPRLFDDPSISVRALPAALHQDEVLRDARQRFMTTEISRGRADPNAGVNTQGITVNVPITMPGALKEVFGRGATNIKVSGRENISFAGESRRVTPFTPNEQGRGQSLFPRLDMKQDLQVKLEGTIGDKVHAEVDHNSAGFGETANRINIYYEGYEDDVVRRVDLGGTNLTLPGSNLVSFSGGAKGLFGIKSTMRLGGLDLTVIASKQEAEIETRSLTPTGGTPRPQIFAERDYARDRFFFYEIPDTTFNFYDSHGVNPELLIDQNLVPNFQVFVDDQSTATEDDRTYLGFAVEGMPAGLDTLSMNQVYDLAPPTRRHPEQGGRAQWRRLDNDLDVGFIYHQLENRKLVLGFFLRQGAVDDDDAVAVQFNDPFNEPVGDVNESAGNRVKLRLVRHPRQENDFYAYPTALYMMRFVYPLGSTNLNLTAFNVRVVTDQLRQNPETPLRIPTSTYLHMFGMDDVDTESRPAPDALFDVSRVNLLDPVEGLLFLPGTRPFDPPDEVLIRRLVGAGFSASGAQDSLDILFPEEERVQTTLYTLRALDPLLPSGRYRIEVVSAGTESEIILPQEIIEGTEVVRLDGRELVRGTDYDIEYFAGGKITLKGDVLTTMSPSSRIDVSYQFKPLFGAGRSTLMGASGEYLLGNRGRLASVWLYESTGGFARHPKLGEEPTRTMLGDVNGSLRFEPGWMTRLVNLLPFTETGAKSSLNVTAEAAVSLPNPNTREVASVDDLEGADDSDDQNLGRNNWHLASIPVFENPARDDTTLRVPLAYYNPSAAKVKRGYLNPTLDEREAEEGLTVLEIGFDQIRKDSLLADPSKRPRLWGGIMRSFGNAGLDLNRTKSIEFWLNDQIGDPAQRHGRLHIDLGDVSENFIFFPNRPDQNLGGSPDFNREANRQVEFQAALDDLGWDGVEQGCDRDQPPTSFGSDCYLPEVSNLIGQHFLANGTEKNNEYDTEDINGNGVFNESNSYFGVTVDLADTTFVEVDVNPTYGDDPTIPEALKREFRGWRKYRIDLDRIDFEELRDPGTAAPTLAQIRFLRLWFEDTGGATDSTSIFSRNLQIYGLKLTKNQWYEVGVFGIDRSLVEPEIGETFSVGVINNKEDAGIYELPPDAFELDESGLQASEQSLRLDFNNLEPGHEVLLERNLAATGRGLDFTLYQRLTYFVHYPVALSDTTEFFFRVGTDTLNYYEVAQTVPGGGPWVELNVDLDQLTGLKFPLDYPGGVTRDTVLVRGSTSIRQTTAETVDARNPTQRLLVTVRGDPSFQSVTRLFVGVRNRGRGSGARPVSGQVWFDNVQLDDVERTAGVAHSYSATARFGDVLDGSTSFTYRNADFRSLRQRTGSGADTYNFQGRLSTELSKWVPTLGFNIPVSYNYSHDEARPKFFSQSDTRNTDERKVEQRTEGVRTAYGISFGKRPSRFWVNQVTLDRLLFSFSESRVKTRSFSSRDSSLSRSRTLTYDLVPRERAFKLFRGTRLNLIPNSFKFSLQQSSTISTNYTVLRPRGSVTDSLVKRPSNPVRGINVTASAAMRPLPIVSMRYTFAEPRNYRLTHPSNEAERLKIAGIDFGLPVGRSEAVNVDVTPRRFRFAYAASFGDQRLTRGITDPETHTSASNRSRRLSFDFAMHRRVFGWMAGAPGAAGGRNDRDPGQDPEAEPFVPDRGRELDELERQQDENPQRPPREDASPQPGAGSGPPPSPPFMPPLPGSVPGDSLATSSPALPDTSGADAPAPIPVPPVVPPGAMPPPVAAADTARAKPPRRTINPIKLILRKVSEIDPIKVEVADSRNLSYTGLPDAPTGGFRYGFSRSSGVDGFDVPTPEDRRYIVDLATAVPLRQTLRVGVRYKREHGVRETRVFGVNALTNRDYTTDVTSPSFDLNINNIERSRLFRPLGGRVERASASFGFSRSLGERYRTEERPDRAGGGRLGPYQFRSPDVQRQHDRPVARRHVDHARTQSIQHHQRESGLKTQGVQRSLTLGVRFKLNPKGGIQLPFLGSRGRLKSGMDVTLNSSYNQDRRTVFNDPANPTRGRPDAHTDAINLNARSDYTLSRNINGGLEMGVTRNSRNDQVEQSILTIRIGFNLTFLF